MTTRCVEMNNQYLPHEFKKITSGDMRNQSAPTYQGGTHRLLLSPFQLSDTPQFALLASEPRVQATDICFDGPITEVRAKEIIEFYQKAWQDKAAYFMGIRNKVTAELMGSVSLSFTPAFERAELGFWLGLPYWGRGIVTEAAEAMLRFGFYELDLHRINSQHLSHNPASGKVMQKLGMKYEGCLRQHVRIKETWYHMHQYGILKEEHLQLGHLRLRELALT